MPPDSRPLPPGDQPATPHGPTHWPNVPACYDWLSLDRRGQWRLQDERVSHAGLLAFLNRHYGCDAAGNWFVQNGPQRVYVRLGYTPWVFHLREGALWAHTGQPAGDFTALFLDDGGNLLIRTTLGIGLLDDRDLAAVLADCRDADGAPAGEDALLALMNGEQQAVFWQNMPVQPLAAVDVPKTFFFNPAPALI